MSTKKLHVMFLPLMAPGHMLPIKDMATLFANRGVKTTIVTTSLNAHIFTESANISVRLIKFPAEEVGLPNGIENLDQVTSEEILDKFFDAMTMLQHPMEPVLDEYRPDCLIAGMFFPWATDLAARFGIPRLVFCSSSFLTMCIEECIHKYKPHENTTSATEHFLLPDLPGSIKLTKAQLPSHLTQESENNYTKLFDGVRESFKRSYGVIGNSFYELESAYIDHFRRESKAWHVGPLQRGKKMESSIDGYDCLKWLDSKEPNSVIYVCFGSLSRITHSQLLEIAIGLEASEQSFVWVVRNEYWPIPDGYEGRIKGRGLIIRGWAPQVLILDHESIGGFVTHCGWNSILEGVSAGLPMVTWPMFAEQFFNEKLVTDVLKTGVGVGADRWGLFREDVVKREDIEKAVKRVMVGEEAKEKRSRARTLGQIARSATEEGGSSYNDLNALIEELAAGNQLLA